MTDKIPSIRKAYLTMAVLVNVCVSGPAYACLSIDVSAADINTGNYNPLSGAASHTDFSVQLRCVSDGVLPTLPMAYRIGMQSLKGGSDGATNALRYGKFRLQYHLLSTHQANRRWGTLHSTEAVTGSFESQIIPPTQLIRGSLLIPARQNVPSGTYVDQLSITLEF